MCSAVAGYNCKTIVAIAINEAPAKQSLQQVTAASNAVWLHESPFEKFCFPGALPHVSFGAFFSRDRYHSNMIIEGIRKRFFQEAYPFFVGPYHQNVIILPKDEANATRSRDPLVITLKTVDPGMNGNPQVLVNLNKKVAEVVARLGGTMERETFIPHVTIGTVPSNQGAEMMQWPVTAQVMPFRLDPKNFHFFVFSGH
jgi:hypothetical protein